MGLLPEIEELKRIRLDEDLLLSDLASQLGLTESGLSRLERGLTQPLERTLHRIRKYLDARRAAAAAAAKSKRPAARRGGSSRRRSTSMEAQP